MRRQAQAFTLAELLTAVAVIALLLSIVGAAYPGVMASTRRMLCANNLHQLGVLVRGTRDRLADEDEHTVQYSDFLHTLQWPDRVYETGNQKPGLFLCPEATEAYRPDNPDIVYRSGIDRNVYVPFDPSEFLCCMRKGTDEYGMPYTEYCIEENPGVQSKWTHEPCCGQPSWSTNDGIWRVYDKGQGGKRRLVLVYYDCWWGNELYVDGKQYSTDLWQLLGMTIYFNDCPTNYGYNTDLEFTNGVDPGTIVLLDYEDVLADPNDTDMPDKLDRSGRHKGKHNVLLAHGGVEQRETFDLYPVLNGSPWTPAADREGKPYGVPDADDEVAPEGTDLEDLIPT
jgi:prepilin-type N-terminal cleavage/methylation domain-containing protein